MKTKLTLDEKIRLLNGVGSWSTYDANGKLPVIKMSDGPHGLRKQDEEKYSDINDSKISTCFPTASCLASSWNRETLALVAKTIGEEAVAEKVDIVLGCGMNIKRSPLCGRNFEYFAEDPYLAGELAVNYVKGLQSTGTGASIKHFAANNQEKRRQTSDSIIDERALREIYLYAFEKAVKESSPATVMESYNKLNGEYVSRSHRLLQEILREEWGFQGAVISDWGAAINIAECIKGGLDLAMPDSFGFHTEELKKALAEGRLTEADIDRAVENIVRLAKRLKPDFFDEGARTSDGAGREAGRTSPTDSANVSHQAEGISPELFAKAHDIARKAACDSAVLLKNDGILPIRTPESHTGSPTSETDKASEEAGSPSVGSHTSETDKASEEAGSPSVGCPTSDAHKEGEADDKAGASKPELIIIGEMAQKIRYQGGGSSHISTAPIKDAIKAFSDKGFKVLYQQGYSEKLATEIDATQRDDTKADKPASSRKAEELAQAALKLCQKAAADNIPVLFFCGLTDKFEGEGFDRDRLDIPAQQLSLLNRIIKTGCPVIAVTFSGSPISMPFVKDVKAILHMYLAGEASAEACADLITGEVNPSGKLAETFPLRGEDVPSAPWFAKETDTVEYRESIFVGYRYYESFKIPVLFEFGYGLSYSSFEYSDLKVTPPDANQKVTVTFTVKNTGSLKGSEIAQIYVLPPDSGIIRSKIELKGFEKVELEAGQSKQVSITLDNRSFSIYSPERKDFVIPEGEYTIAAAASVKDIRLTATVQLTGLSLDSQKKDFPSYFPKAEGADDSTQGYSSPKGTFDVPHDEFERLYGLGFSGKRSIPEHKTPQKGSFTLENSISSMAESSRFSRFFMRTFEKIIYFQNRDKEKDDPAVKISIQAVKENPLESLISTSNGQISAKLLKFIVKRSNGRKGPENRK
ncbi:MAG: glycoside hydrolase family 3 C-terminal domain-containing protein [Treponemataceae bacterium]|nr:glycoside hydrolase family 3 C-terminal domain-containing protein [Treponemataceae bacterium]